MEMFLVALIWLVNAVLLVAAIRGFREEERKRARMFALMLIAEAKNYD